MVTPVRENGLPATHLTRADPALVKALARAFRYQRLLDEGRYASITEMAVAERIERGYLGALLRLTLLAPNIVEAVLDGRQPQRTTLPGLMEPFPVEWARQQRLVVVVQLPNNQDRLGVADFSRRDQAGLKAHRQR